MSGPRRGLLHAPLHLFLLLMFLALYPGADHDFCRFCCCESCKAYGKRLRAIKKVVLRIRRGFEYHGMVRHTRGMIRDRTRRNELGDHALYIIHTIVLPYVRDIFFFIFRSRDNIGIK